MIYFLRHTIPEVEQGICYGQSDLMVADGFYNDELPKVIKTVEKLNVDAIYSSPLKRCKILADEISEVLGVEFVESDSFLMELNFGQWELWSWSQIFECERGKLWFENYLTATTPDGESFMDMVSRAKQFFSKTEYENRDILIVTHVGFIRAAMVALGKAEIEEAFNIKVMYGELYCL